MFELATDEKAKALNAQFTGLVDAVKSAYQLPYTQFSVESDRFCFAPFKNVQMGNSINLSFSKDSIEVRLAVFNSDVGTIVEQALGKRPITVEAELRKLKEDEGVDPYKKACTENIKNVSAAVSDWLGVPVIMKGMFSDEYGSPTFGIITMEMDKVTPQHISALSVLLQKSRFTPNATPGRYTL